MNIIDIMTKNIKNILDLFKEHGDTLFTEDKVQAILAFHLFLLENSKQKRASKYSQHAYPSTMEAMAHIVVPLMKLY